MSFSDSLLAAAKSASSAYIQFITGRAREAYKAYAFVEDDDDIQFYQHSLLEVDNICYLSCGGKTHVLEVYNKLSQDGLADRQLFFVDRDTEMEDTPAPNAILRTHGYSWESHAFEEDSLHSFLQRKFNPSISTNEATSLIFRWNATFEKYRDIVSRQYALMTEAARCGLRAEVANIPLARGSASHNGILSPSDQVVIQIADAAQRLLLQGAVQANIDSYQAHANDNGLLRLGRGKSIYQILRAFIQYELTQANASFRVDYNSPLVAILHIPWNSPRFDYIREYVAGRLAA